MTKDRNLKKAVRARMAVTGESYSTARRAVLEDSSGAVQRVFGASRMVPPRVPNLHDEAADSVRGILDQLQDRELEKLGNLDELWEHLPLSDPTLQGAELDEGSIVVDTMEWYEGGTAAMGVSARVEIEFDGIMSKADAINAEAAGEVVFIDFDLTKHDAHVQVVGSRSVMFEFTANGTPSDATFESFEFAGAVA